MNLSFVKYNLIITILALFFVSCNDNVISSIPDYPVYLNLNLTSTYPTFRNSHLHYILFAKGINVIDRVGFGGILVVTGIDGSYYAFDMSCPYEANKDILVFPNGSKEKNATEYFSHNGQVVCEKCGSVFDITSGFGNPISGKAKETLKRYKANLSGDILSINP